LLGREVRFALGSRRLAQRPVEVVGPGVVRTLERLPAASTGCDHRAAVPADVHEGTQRPLAAADDDQWHVAGIAGDVGAGLADPFGRAGIRPRTLEDALLLPGEYVGGHVPVPRKRARVHVAIVRLAPWRSAR